MLLEDDIRLIVGLYGWKLSLRRLHPDHPVYMAYIYWHRRKHCLGLLGEVQCLDADQLIELLLTCADAPEEEEGQDRQQQRWHIFCQAARRHSLEKI